MTGESDLPRAWWHGCWLEPGHHLFGRGGRYSPKDCPLRTATDDAYWLDGGLAPRRLSSRARLPSALLTIPEDRIVFTRLAGDDRELRLRIEGRSEECAQGEFLLHAIAGCTVAAWWDRTQGDTRSACNSCLIVEGVGWISQVMLNLFPRLFPAQAGRLAAAGVQLHFLRWAS